VSPACGAPHVIIGDFSADCYASSPYARWRYKIIKNSHANLKTTSQLTALFIQFNYIHIKTNSF